MVKKKITKSTAIWNGRRDDGGAGRLEEILEAWLAGMSGKTPSTLKKYEDIVHKETILSGRSFRDSDVSSVIDRVSVVGG